MTSYPQLFRLRQQFEGPVVEDVAVEVEEVPLEGQAKANYQTQAARANYLCLDRPDISFATKETMRRLSNPTTDDEAALKKLGKYLLGKPRVVSNFKYGEEWQFGD